MKIKKKSLLWVSLALGLAGTGAYRTLSYLSSQKTEVNQLRTVGRDGLNAELTEPSWKEEKGFLVLPDMVIPKDPQVTNTSVLNLDELAALQCEFVYTAACPEKEKAGTLLSPADMEYVAEVFEIDYNSDDEALGDWVRFEGQTGRDARQCFYYRDTLKRNLPEAGDTTVPLFTRLRIDKSVDNARFSYIQKIGGFDIRISGLVLQQMSGETYFGLASARSAYEAGLFVFKEKEQL